VCCLNDIAAADMADHLASLVDKSLVVAEPYEDIVRYRLQETLRQYGTERLAETTSGSLGPGEADLVHAAHADHYLGFAEQVGPNLDGRFVHQWVRRLDVEELNLRAAIAHSLGTTDGADRVLGQFWCLRRYWHYARQPAQALVLLERARERAGPGITPEREGRALYCTSLLLNLVDRRLQLEAISTALDLARAAGDATLEADAMARTSRSLADNGRGPEALEVGAKALTLARQIGEPVLLGTVLYQYASVLDETDAAVAEAVYLEALGLVEESGDERTAWHLHNNYACLLIAEGNIGAAKRHLEVAIELNGNELTTRSASAYNNLGWVMLQEGDALLAASYHRDVLRSSRLNGTVWMIPYALLGMARCATQLGAFERAALLHGGAAASLEPVAAQWEVLEETLRAKDIGRLQEELGSEFEPLYAKGLSMPQSEIVKLALTRA
jgi:tetratricopeptide (TPR) repeat protein